MDDVITIDRVLQSMVMASSHDEVTPYIAIDKARVKVKISRKPRNDIERNKRKRHGITENVAKA